MTEPVRLDSRAAPGWQLGPGLAVWLVAGSVLAIVGLALRRPDVAGLGTPFLIGAVWAWTRTPGRACRVSLRGPDQPVASGTLSSRIAIATDEPVVLAVRVAAPGHRGTQALIAVPDDREVEVAMRSVRTGRRDLFRLDHRAASPDLFHLRQVTVAPPAKLTVLPRTHPLRSLPLPFRLQGLTGPHPSRRAGEGGELNDISPFRPGDRLRRIDWRVTARLNHAHPLPGARRSGITELYVRRTSALADACVMLVIDSRDDLGPRVATWGDATRVREDEATSLDIARTAAASLAAAYLADGNRVGLEDLGRLRRPVPPAGGRTQRLRLVNRLALSVPEGEPVSRERIPRLPSGALIVVLSTFLDDDAARMAVSWRQAGHRVVAVDTLPRIVLLGAGERLELAYRIVAMERADRIRGLGHVGVEVVDWSHVGGAADTPAAQLELLARQRGRR